MAVLKKKPRTAGEIPMASTSDVAFLLLIFFIVTCIFAAEQGLFMILPGKQKDSTTVKVKQSNIATLKVHDNNSLSFEDKPIEINHIKQAVEDRLRDNDQTVILIEIHPDADYGQMVACLDEVRLAQAKKVSLKTTE